MNQFVNIYKINDNSLKIAKDYVLRNIPFGFPTETVYGLGANAFSSEAVKRIFELKGRPQDNPLIVHVHPEYDLDKLVFDNPTAKKLREAFLPGPLTMVYKSKGVVSPLVCRGLDTLAIRIPKHEGALKILKYLDLPIAAPSANKSKHTSPVTAEHVYEDFGLEVPLIFDGGRSQGGIESTVLDVTGDVPIVLRKGLITAEMIKKVVGECRYAEDGESLMKRSPGTRYSHYKPKTNTKLFKADEIDLLIEFYDRLRSQGKTALILCEEKVVGRVGKRSCFSLGSDGETMANRLYYGLREGEKYDYLLGVDFLLDDEVKLGVANRFLKAFAE
ncbi:MAG: threonylcarbamoyl-AMP synthase [Clostridia bacterium]|nr:threonylcarbamoyl-AMP synthase [Clostridia bacterium]